MARLNTKDRELLRTGKDIDLTSTSYAYLGGKFLTNPNDYIEALIYDTDENFLESAVVDSTDYTFDEDNPTIRLKTGTILRKLGYDRGRYIIKYNFLRKIAGSYETILVDESNNPYDGEYEVQPSGKIVTPTDEELSLKEYKYFIHEISPTRKEVRLATQNIKDVQYLRDFYDLQKTIKKVVPDTSIPNHKLEFFPIGGLYNESKTIKFNDSPGGPVANFSGIMAGGILSLNNAFVTEVLTSVSAETPGNIDREVFGTELTARFAISEESQAEISKAAPTATGGGRLDRLYEVYNGLVMTSPAGGLVGISRIGDGTVGGIQEIDDVYYGSPKYVWNEDAPQTIELTSISTIVTGSPNTYTWELFGWDRDAKIKRNIFNQKYTDGYTWEKIRQKTTTNDGDVRILAGGYGGSPQTSLIYTDPDRTDGSTIAVELHSKHLHVGVRLTVSNDLNQESTIVYPAFLKTA